MSKWDELDDAGLHVHLRLGLTKGGHGPADPPDPAFDHWGCWCADVSCPGPPPSYCEDVACPSKQRCTDPDCIPAKETP